EQAREWARSKNAPAEFVDLAELYWELAPKHGGVDPAVAYVQFGHETGYLYRDGRSAAGIDASYKNPCGLKVTAGGGDYQASAHKRFTDWREGITAHLELCKKYATEHSYKVEEVFLDHGFSANSERPEFENVRKFMDENPNGTLIVSSYDRLERDSMKMYEFCQNIKEVNYNVVSANNNDRSFKELELICGIDKISKEQKASE
ncbi:recombinase family protein, partial [Paenibacillus dendritiformis]